MDARVSVSSMRPDAWSSPLDFYAFVATQGERGERHVADIGEPTFYVPGMSRPLWSRVTALILGFWFAAVSAGPELTHACPMHGAHAAVAALNTHSGHGGAHAPHVAGLGHHQTSSSESASHHGTQCTCLGQCCGTGPVATVAATVALADSGTLATRDAGLPDYVYVPVAAQHVLPLAHAPPLSA